LTEVADASAPATPAATPFSASVDKLMNLGIATAGQDADDHDGDDQFDQREALVGQFPDFRIHA
jgi:hypothetical protein